MIKLTALPLRFGRKFILAVAGVLLSGSPVLSSCLEDGLSADHAQIRATAPNAPASAGYLQLTNKTGQTQTLMAASAPFSQLTQIHDMKHEDGVMKMQEITGGLVVPDGLTIKLMPKGRHLMFMGLDRQLNAGEAFEITLNFTPCGQVTLPFTVVSTPGHHTH